MNADEAIDAAVRAIPAGCSLWTALLRVEERFGLGSLSPRTDGGIAVRLRPETSVASPAGEVTEVRRGLVAGRPALEIRVASPGFEGSMARADPIVAARLASADGTTRDLLDAAFHRLGTLRFLAWRRATRRELGSLVVGGDDGAAHERPAANALPASLRQPMSADSLLGLVQERCDPWPARIEQACEVRARFRDAPEHRLGRAAALGDNALLGGVARERISTFDLVVGPAPEGEAADPDGSVHRFARLLIDWLRPLVPPGLSCRVWLELERPEGRPASLSRDAWNASGRIAWLARGHGHRVRIALGTAGMPSAAPRVVARTALRGTLP